MQVARRVLTELQLVMLPVLIACLLYIFFGAGLFLIFRDNTTLIGSLAPNLFAGSIDTLFVVILISYILARRTRQEQRPMRYAAYLQAVAALAIFRLTWRDMIVASGRTMPPVGDNLLDDKYVDQVAAHLDLDQPSGIMQTRWLSRASAAGIMIRESIGTITARYAAALSPEMIVTCTAFENSGLIRNLAMLQTANLPFTQKGTTMQKPFILEYAKDSLQDVRAFIALVEELAHDFRGEQGYREPPPFIVTAEMAAGGSSVVKLGSAYVE